MSNVSDRSAMPLSALCEAVEADLVLITTRVVKPGPLSLRQRAQAIKHLNALASVLANLKSLLQTEEEVDHGHD